MKHIGFLGILSSLPSDFPLNFNENSGNIVHGGAPSRLFNNIIDVKKQFNIYGDCSVIKFINKRCSHLILTLANTLRHQDDDKYISAIKFLEKIEIPIIPFGLGAQSHFSDIESINLPPAGIKWLVLLSKKSKLISVRGSFTRDILAKYGINNTFITGCPSFYTAPKKFKELILPRSGNPSISLTNYKNEFELNLLLAAINKGIFLVEPVNKFMYKYYISSLISTNKIENFPYFLKASINNNSLDVDKFHYYISRNFKLFRNYDDWSAFNSDFVSYTFGTRFHVNMASILNGVPALWITHDSRTRELVDYLCLPSIELHKIYNMDIDNVSSYIKFEKTLDNLDLLFARFNDFLESNDLPTINCP